MYKRKLMALLQHSPHRGMRLKRNERYRYPSELVKKTKRGVLMV